MQQPGKKKPYLKSWKDRESVATLVNARYEPSGTISIAQTQEERNKQMFSKWSELTNVIDHDIITDIVYQLFPLQVKVHWAWC